MPLKPFAQLRCRGTHYEMGIIQGRWLRPRFERIFASLLENPIVPTWVRWLGPQFLKVLLTIMGVYVSENHLRNMKKIAPSQVSRIMGMAKGAKWTPELLLGLGAIETRSAHYQYILGCTSLGIAPSRCQDGHPLLAYNHDFPAMLRDHLFIRHSKPYEGYASVQLTYPTLPGCIAGVNDEGVAISLNHAFSTEPFNHGVPPTFLVQDALDQCETADEVVEMFEKASFSCGSMATVVDKSGDMYAMELSRERFGVRVPQNGISLTLNDYQIDHMQAVEVPKEALFHPRKFPEVFHDLHIHQANWERRKRFELLLNQEIPFSEREIKILMADHDGASQGRLGTVCRHHETSDTIATALIYPKERVMYAGRGHTCRVKYQKFTV